MMLESLPSWAPWAGAAWCVLAAIWLLALEKDVKVKWIHRLHALLPIGAMAAAYVLWPDPVAAKWTAAWLLVGGFIVIFLTPVWLFTLATRNSGVMDVVYTPTALLPILALFLLDGALSTRELMVLALMCIWSGRLVFHVSSTNLGDRGEQQPYASWRVKFGRKWWWWSFFQVFLLQGGIAWVWVLPLVFFATSPAESPVLSDYVAIAIWCVGFFFQSVADRQLKNFKSDPANKGKVLQSGLWSLSRHPNYFGEATMWFSYFVFGLSHPWGVLGVAAVVYVTWFMSRGSAAAMLDRHMLRTKPDYADYVRRVPGFFPLYKSPMDETLLEWAAARRSRA